jgi:hypothetical protein
MLPLYNFIYILSLIYLFNILYKIYKNLVISNESSQEFFLNHFDSCFVHIIQTHSSIFSKFDLGLLE